MKVIRIWCFVERIEQIALCKDKLSLRDCLRDIDDESLNIDDSYLVVNELIPLAERYDFDDKWYIKALKYGYIHTKNYEGEIDVDHYETIIGLLGRLL